MKFFHYLLESQPGVGEAVRVDDTTVRLTLPHLTIGEEGYELNVDHRDQRVLVVVDAEPLTSSIPKAGDMIYSTKITDLKTNADHLRIPWFGDPSYVISEVGGRKIATLELNRRFFLLPSSISLFRLVRDVRSLGPMYTFAVVTKTENGPTVTWMKSSY